MSGLDFCRNNSGKYLFLKALRIALENLKREIQAFGYKKQNSFTEFKEETNFYVF